MTISGKRWWNRLPLSLSALALTTVLSVGCSHGKSKSSEVASANGPVVTDQRARPDKIELNRFLQTLEPQDFLVEVRDPVADVTDVHLQIPGSRVSIPMESVGPNLWRGTLAENQVAQLATGGKTVEYQAQVIARDSKGNVVTGKEPLKFRIVAPSLDDRVG